ncbi:hypothetical protein KSE_05960 [Kitasatospora setae KM-6054]|uniref:Transposase IS4-like domain-containing protein n=1 Tax=Kitasatospora setae (strain ATCC 33774 / DSM 43861 / JCM 3304 / KCC A-0304 / NBRC 14216 / KM-6054) TaxID=452652 RepID=E4N5F7_KITSK|nr:hypothetical protein KSE_05960 [Kitasatospora setae KM-6054]
MPDDLRERVAPLLPPGGARTRSCSPSRGRRACRRRTTRRSTARTSGPSKEAHTGPPPVDRGRPGSKQHLIVDRHGTPLAVALTGGNRHDVTRCVGAPAGRLLRLRAVHGGHRCRRRPLARHRPAAASR